MPITQAKILLSKYANWYSQGQFETLVFVGTDDNALEQTFDFKTMIQSLNVDMKKEENNRYDPELVKVEFFKIVR